MPENYGDLSRLSPAEFAAVMAHTLLVASDYLEGLGGYGEGEEIDGPEKLAAAVAAEIRRRGLEQAYREASLSGTDGAAVPHAPEDLFMGAVEVELTGLAVMRQRWTLHLAEPTPRADVEARARDSAGNYVWDYQCMLDETVEVSLPG